MQLAVNNWGQFFQSPMVAFTPCAQKDTYLTRGMCIAHHHRCRELYRVWHDPCREGSAPYTIGGRTKMKMIQMFILAAGLLPGLAMAQHQPRYVVTDLGTLRRGVQLLIRNQ